MKMNKKTDTVFQSDNSNIKDNNCISDIETVYKHRLFLYVSGCTGNASTVGRIVEETIMLTGKNRNKLHSESDVRIFLFEKASQLIRKDTRTEYIEHDNSHMIPFKDDCKNSLYESMQKLNSQDFRVMYLTYFERMTEEEISKVIHRNRSEVKKESELAREKLRGILDEAGVSTYN